MAKEDCSIKGQPGVGLKALFRSVAYANVKCGRMVIGSEEDLSCQGIGEAGGEGDQLCGNLYQSAEPMEGKVRFFLLPIALRLLSHQLDKFFQGGRLQSYSVSCQEEQGMAEEDFFGPGEAKEGEEAISH